MADGHEKVTLMQLGGLVPFFVIFGLVGNLISVMILTRPRMISSMSILLAGLAVSDTLVLSSVLITALSDSIFDTFKSIIYTSILFIGHTISAYLTLALTLERYVAICRPPQALWLCTHGQALASVIFIMIFSIILNVDRFRAKDVWGQYEAFGSTIGYSPRNETSTYSLVCTIFTTVVPITSIFGLNATIYRQIKVLNREAQSASQQNQIRLWEMLVCITLTFLLCHAVFVFITVCEAFNIQILSIYVRAVSSLVSLCLVTLNSSVNFIIYTVHSEGFRRLIFDFLCQYPIRRGVPR